MSNPLGTADFFALEAGECLDRLETLMARPDGPPHDEFLRYARALRGSALMANQPAIARAAAGLEALSRGLRDGAVRWEPGVRERAGQAVDEFRQLVRRARDWSSADAGRAARLAADLEYLAGAPVAAPPAMPAMPSDPAELNTGVRAFVAREAALIASALDRAARALQETPDAREPLYGVLRRMQSLRGLAELGELPPLPEILDGIELAVGDLTRLFAPPPGVSELLDSAARSLTRVARDVAGTGRPDPDPAEAREFTELLLRAFAVERDVVPIESLYVDGDATPFRRNDTQPQFSAPSPLGPLEVVSYGEHLFQLADRIEDAVSATTRDLRLYALVGTLRSIASGGTEPVPAALAVFGRSARESIGNGAAAADPAEFAACLREAGALLKSLADSGDQHLVGRRMLDLAHRLDLRHPASADATSATVSAAPSDPASPAQLEAPAADDADDVSITSLAYDVAPGERPVVPIESLAYAVDAAPQRATATVPIAALAPVDGPSQLETSYLTYSRLITTKVPPSAAALVTTVEPIAAGGAEGAPDADSVDIMLLCYRGRGALERAATIRNSLAAELAQARDLTSLEPLLRELLDLVPLALEHAD